VEEGINREKGEGVWVWERGRDRYEGLVEKLRREGEKDGLGSNNGGRGIC
jgi:hypothetical protein